jgi:hypothetical protein
MGWHFVGLLGDHYDTDPIFVLHLWGKVEKEKQILTHTNKEQRY